ncbi:MAG: methyl-accepting chemotaxis protein [Rhodocyclaceae bacterium]|nr:methyl-accepting chemotaxis protein [Rhodocyclaceae bacterium]
MKNNGPVTQREASFPVGKYLVSKTDLRGIITYCNDAFIALSGFEKAELIGKSHNIVRHPDMPAVAFADLWTTVKAGRPWRGRVKNRCKNGDHYWVDAFVVPLRKNGETTGYMSVRSAPTREQVRDAEALYQQINAGSGKLPKTGGFLASLSIRARLIGVMALLAAMIAVGSLIGVVGLSQSNEALRIAYDEHMEPAVAIAKMVERLADSRAQIMLGIQHSPDNRYSKLHDHPLARHTEATQANRKVIEDLRATYEKKPKSADEKVLAEAFSAARDAYSKEGVGLAHEALSAGDYDTAQALLLNKINPLYAQVREQGEKLQSYLAAEGDKAHDQAKVGYTWVLNAAIFGTLTAILLVVVVGGLLVKSIVAPMRQAIRHFERIADGILTDEVDITRRDEAGQLMSTLAVMQVNLKVALDEVRLVSVALDEESKKLAAEMDRVVDQSVQQQDRVQGTAAATEELTVSVAEVASSVAGTAQAATQSKVLVAESTRSMDSSMAATSRVVGAVQASSATIGDLNRAIEKIGVITNTIREIAEQTNLLALNAAIEAARAGEQGRGFAVVADEVRKLAERTSSSTADINNTVNEFQKVTQQAVSSMEQAAREVEVGMGQMRASVTSLDQIRVSSDEVATMADNIAAASREQAVASQDVAVNMEQVSSLIEQNTQSARSAQQGAASLSATAVVLRNVVARFELVKR